MTITSSLRQPESTTPDRSPGYGPVIPAFITIFTVATTINFLAPLLLALSGDFGVSLAEAGQLVVATAVTWGIASPFTGLVGDRFGRRPVIVTALVGMGLATVAGALVTEFWLLIILRAAVGLFGSGGPPSVMAGIGDLYPPRMRGRAVGWTMSGFSVAALVGVPLAGALGGAAGWRMAFVAIGLSLLAAAGFVRLTFPPGQRGGGGSNPLQIYGRLLRVPHLGVVLTANVFERLTFMAFSLYFAPFLIQRYDLTPVTIAPALSIAALGAILGNITGGFLADRFSRPGVAAICLLFSGGLGLAVFAWELPLVLAVACGLGFGLVNAAAKAPHFALAIGLSEQNRGALLGLIALSNQIGFAVGAGIGGAIASATGFAGLGWLIIALSLAAAGLLSTLLGRFPRPVSRAPTAAVGERT